MNDKIAVITIAFVIAYIIFFLFCLLVNSMLSNYDKRKFQQAEKERALREWRKITKL